MKFRYKVIIINIILLSLGLSTVGYLMIKRNYELAMDNQIRSAIEENNIIQSTLEYSMLDVINANMNISEKLSEIGEQSFTNIIDESTCVYVLYNSKVVYTSNAESYELPDSLMETQDIGVKKYYITTENGSHFIYVSTCNVMGSSNYSIVNRTDISSVYEMVEQQKQYFVLLLIATIAICSLFMLIVSYFLTKPLEKLNSVSASFGRGDYAARVNIHSSDEIGELADTYNHMAESVSDHVDELNDMIKRRDQFVADFTHELKTPMTSIIGYSDMLRSKDLSREDQIMSASYIFNEGKRLESMSLKLFDFIYLRNHDIESKPFMTQTLADRVSSSVLPSLDKKSIKLKLDFENVKLDGDINLLTSAFINLVDNARKASHDNSEIIFSGHRNDDSYDITVQDFGIGISEDNIKRICDEFFMADKSRSRKEGGAGLGLSLAATIFEAHGAELSIASELGKGTSMTVTFSHYNEVNGDE